MPASESAVYALIRELQTTRDLITDVRTYAINLKDLVNTIATTARPTTITNFPVGLNVNNFPGVQPVSIPNLPNPLPTREIPVAVNSDFASLSATGDLVALHVGSAIRLMAGIFSATVTVTVALRSGAINLLPMSLLAGASVVLPWNNAGWCTTSVGQPLKIAFTGVNTVTGFAQWIAV